MILNEKISFQEPPISFGIDRLLLFFANFSHKFNDYQNDQDYQDYQDGLLNFIEFLEQNRSRASNFGSETRTELIRKYWEQVEKFSNNRLFFRIRL